MPADRAARSSVARLARWRVPLGFGCAVVVFLLAEPTWLRLGAGFSLALAGEFVRVWASGHLEKGREVTASGPYRWVAHPLYIGSTLIGAGIAMAAGTLWAVLVIAAYLGLTLTAAIRAEEAALAEKFGAAYESYRAGRAIGSTRSFSLARAGRNREYRAALGVVAGFGLLAAKLLLRM